MRVRSKKSTYISAIAFLHCSELRNILGYTLQSVFFPTHMSSQEHVYFPSPIHLPTFCSNQLFSISTLHTFLRSRHQMDLAFILPSRRDVCIQIAIFSLQLSNPTPTLLLQQIPTPFTHKCIVKDYQILYSQTSLLLGHTIPPYPSYLPLLSSPFPPHKKFLCNALISINFANLICHHLIKKY